MAAITSVSGFPRIGAHRELKRAIEGYWKGERNLDEVRRTAADLRARHWQLQQEAGVDLIPVNDFSYYDQVLDTSILLGVVPERYRKLGLGPEDTLFAMGRGYQGEQGDVTALPMKKWFTTNYHYLVPEIDQDTKIVLEGDKPFKEFQEAREQGIAAKPVLIGPYTFLKLARGPQGELLDPDPALIQDLAKAYSTILERFIGLNADWVQLDEPYLVLDKERGDQDLFEILYRPILKARESDKGKVRILLNTYFGHVGDCYDRLADLGFDGIGLDLVEGRDENLAALKEHGVPDGTTIFAGLVNGRNIWRNDYAVSLGLLDALHQVTSNVVVSTACSLLHVPYTVADEDGLDADTVRPHFAFALEKLGELHDLAQLADADEDQRRSSKALADNQRLFDGSRVQPDPQVQQRLAGLKDEDFVRTPARPERQRIQAQELGLPLLPTTTIGSFPRPQRSAPSGPAFARRRSARRTTTASSPAKSTRSSTTRSRSAWMFWSMASSSATTWSNTSARTSRATCSPGMPGSSPMAPVASSLRLSGGTFPAPGPSPCAGPHTPSPVPTMWSRGC